MILVIIPVSDRHNLLSGGETPWCECDQDGIWYGHYWIWDLVKLVNAGGGYWDGIGLPVGWPGMDGKSGGSRRLAANHPSPSWDGEGTLWKWRRGEWLLSGDKKKIIIFYNMKCKDVLDKKLRVVGENEIAWHESRCNIGLLSDSDRCLLRSLWFGGYVRCSYWIARSWSW